MVLPKQHYDTDTDADSDEATMHDPDWSLLPSDLLQAISEKVVASLADYADHLRFRAVCHRWRSALSPRPLHLLHQAPWLMLRYPPLSKDHSTCLFYDLSASKFHSLHLPEIRGFQVRGSSHGWLILCKKFQMSLLNPITRAIIALPDFTGPPVHLGFPPPHVLDGELFFRNWDSDQYVMETTTNRVHVLKAMLTSSPLDPGCLVFVHTSDVWQLSFCKIGDDHWTVIEFRYHAPLDLSEFHYIYDFTYSNGCLYTVNAGGAVTMYNLNTPSRVMLNCSVQCSTPIYLVDGSSPEILLVVHLLEVSQSEIEYIVYKFSNGEEPKWIQVSDIGQNVLFVGGERNAIILPSANIMQLPGWGANCLCYESMEERMHYQGQNFAPLFNQSIKLARLDDGQITAKSGVLASFLEDSSDSLWLTPNLH